MTTHPLLWVCGHWLAFLGCLFGQKWPKFKYIPHTKQTTEKGKPMTTHPQQRIMAWWLERKPANNKGRTVRVQTTMRQPNTQQTKRRQTTPRQVRTRPPSDHTNHTPTAAGVWFYVRPLPQPQETPPNKPPSPKQQPARHPRIVTCQNRARRPRESQEPRTCRRVCTFLAEMAENWPKLGT
ncbi:hypothetical protein BS47DRAFT_1357950 [Hydnum rufescens UP504]|uniref:Secreted protein n=1 Tax=Hydnum rufescens UP504 TaxID=1448309 RepID=A0A9P6B8Y2_9AGAM|nr:hypothetical protein BS47DRAFT_1357950 [Hydnum rufescens UP504]